ncbi:hypothetical protein [Sphingomonas sp. SAFR-052]|uniref:hypothetical protein n=1 Tax=Sphingomonas sp. SAFR-052 TaxID=3436867 RepID=UPI003F805426
MAMFQGGIAAAQVRFHSASEEEATALISNELDKARLAHLSALEAHRTYLVDALTREQTLLVQRELAERDALITLILTAKARGEDPFTLLASQIDDEWSELAGTLPKPIAFVDFVSVAHQLNSYEIERAGLIRNRAALISIFEEMGGKGSYCALDGSGQVAFTQRAGTDESDAIIDTCKEISANEARIQSRSILAGPAWALLGNPAGSNAGMIGQALSEVREIALLLETQDVLAKTVAAQMKSLNEYYKCEVDRGSVTQDVRADAAAVQSALNVLAKGDAVTVFKADTFKDVWNKLTSNNIDPNCAKPAPLKASVPEAKGMSADDVLAALGALDKYFTKVAVLALVRDTALDIQGSSLGDALNGLAAAPTDVSASKAAGRVMAALRIFGALEQYSLASAGKMPDITGVLVALADVRMRQATAKTEADRLAELDRLSKLRLVALRQRAVQLAGARNELATKTDAGLSNSLRRYSESVNRGVIPATVLTNGMTKSRTLPWLDREKAVVEAAYAVLAPAAAQLQAYGKSGITPDTVAQFLQAAGLGGIAVK